MRFSFCFFCLNLKRKITGIGKLAESPTRLDIGTITLWTSGVTFFFVLFGLFLSDKLGEAKLAKKKLKEIENRDITEDLQKYGLSKDECVSALLSFKNIPPEKRSITLMYVHLRTAIKALSSGKFDDASENFKKARESLNMVVSYPEDGYKFFGLEGLTWGFGVKYGWFSFLNFAARASDALYLGDIEKIRKLFNEARKMLDNRDEFVIGDIEFFKYLFEFHYFLLKAVVEAYEAEVGTVARATGEQVKRFTKAEPVEIPETVEKVTVSAEEPEKELYRDKVRFKMGLMS